MNLKSTLQYKKLVVLCILIASLKVNCLHGGAGAQFLQIFPGVQIAGLGGAFTAYGGSIESIFWNPSSTVSIRQRSLMFSNANYFAGIRFTNFAFLHPLNNGTLGVSLIALLSGEIEETTEIEDEGTGRSFTANDYAFGLTYSRVMTDKFDAGITMKLLNLNLAKVSATTVSFDFGAIYKMKFLGNLRIGFTIRNYGPDFRYRGEGLIGYTKKSDNPFAEGDVKYELLSASTPLPMSFHLGVKSDLYSGVNSKLSVSFEVVNGVDQKENFLFAIEYCISDFLYVDFSHSNLKALIGHRQNYSYLGGNMRGINWGAGINLGKFFSKVFWFKYSLESHRYLPAIQRYGIEFQF